MQLKKKTPASTEVERPRTNALPLQAAYLAAVNESTGAAEIVAALLASKLEQQKVRLRKSERAALLGAATEFLKTGSEVSLTGAIRRNRKITVTIEEKDLRAIVRAVKKAIPTATQSTVTCLVKEFDRRLRPLTRAAAASHSKATMRFQGRLATQWAVPLGRYSEFLEFARETGSMVSDHWLTSSEFRTRPLVQALVPLHARGCLVAAEIEALMRSGFADGALARWRTLHESAITATFLAEHLDDTAERFLAYQVVEDCRAARAFETHRRKLGFRTIGRKSLAALDDERAAVKQKYGDAFVKRNGWAAAAIGFPEPSFEKIEESVKFEFLNPYYRLASDQVHASARGSMLRLGMPAELRDEGFMAATNYGFAEVAERSATSLLQLTASLLSVEPTIDLMVAVGVMTRWRMPLIIAFYRVQNRVLAAERDLRMRARQRQA
jgi:hypothetical protein